MDKKLEQVEIIARGKYTTYCRSGNWEYVTRPHVSGCVLIIPITDDGKAVLVEQYRIPVKSRVLEWPAGLAGDLPEHAGEDLERSARRELLEETGYEAREMMYLTQGPPSAGLNDEVLSFYLARGLTKVGPGGGDETESIDVHEIPVDHLPEWLAERVAEGVLVDPKLYTGLYFLEKIGV